MSNLDTKPQFEPFAVRPKDGARLAGVGLTLFYERLNDGVYESFLDGTNRLVTVESIKRHQRQLLEAARGTPRENSSKRRGGPGRPKKSAQCAGSHTS
jgi:hypothetical protein